MNRLWLFVCLLLLALPASAQDSGHGVIMYLDESTTPVSGFEFYECRQVNCARPLGLMFPLLFADASDDMAGLVTDAPALPEITQTYTVDSSLTWSDGTAITAYDVAYSLLGRNPLVNNPASPLVGLRIEDDQQITLAFTETDCTTQARINSMIVPAHVFNPDFRPFAEAFAAQAEDLSSPGEWREAYIEWSGSGQWQIMPATGAVEVLNDGFVPVTAGRGTYLQWDDLVLRNVAETGPILAVDRFLRGDANLLLDPPADRHADIQGTPGLQWYAAPGYAVDYLVFNQSDPNYPRDAFIDGEPLEQLPHQYFSDVRVRQAVQLAIDVPALIDSALFGSATALNGAYAPGSWAYDPDLPAQTYDPVAAESLLDAAGWRKINNSTYRQCFNCLHAQTGAQLSINLHVNYDGTRERVAEMLRVQLERVGTSLFISESGNGAGQNFDMLLTGTTNRDPDLYRLFAREWDRLGVEGGNVGSVHHPELEAVLDEARRVPGCNLDERAALYQQAQAILLDEAPAVWLYARHDVYVARDINGFNPMPGDPFWNVKDWVVGR